MATSPETLQMACTLNDEEFATRRKVVRAEIVPHIKRVERLDSGVRYIFSSGISRVSVEEFARFERQCCGFLTFTLSAADEALTLTAEGPPDAQSLYDELVSGSIGQ